MEPIVIHPERIRAFGEEVAEGFCVVTNRAYLDRFRIAESARYPLRRIVPFDEGERFADVLAAAIPEGMHILTILPDCLLHSVGWLRLAVGVATCATDFSRLRRCHGPVAPRCL